MRPGTSWSRSTARFDLIRDDDPDAAIVVLKQHFDDAVVTLKRRRGSENGATALS